jgi:hypothetical protein
MCSGRRRMVALFVPSAVTGTGTPIPGWGALPAAASAGHALPSLMRPRRPVGPAGDTASFEPLTSPLPRALNPSPCQRKVC